MDEQTQYSTSQGYLPRKFEDIVDSIRIRVNEKLGTSYTMSEFTGTNIYKTQYPAIQEAMAIENDLSQIFAKLLDYIDETNESINAPAIVRNSLIDRINKLGVECSLKKLSQGEAGNIFLCCNISTADDNYQYLANEIGKILRDFTAAGTVTNGTQEVSLQLANTQVETFKFSLATRTAILCRLTLKISRNNQYYIPTDDEAKDILLQNLKDLYHLGQDFEPEKYAEINRDFPCCSEVILEYSLDNGLTWSSNVAVLQYNQKYTVNRGDITIVRT